MEKVFVFITFASLQLEGELQIENFNKFLQILFLIWKNKPIFFLFESFTNGILLTELDTKNRLFVVFRSR